MTGAVQGTVILAQADHYQEMLLSSAILSMNLAVRKVRRDLPLLHEIKAVKDFSVILQNCVDECRHLRQAVKFVFGYKCKSLRITSIVRRFACKENIKMKGRVHFHPC